MHVLPRVRLELARRPWLYWLAVAVCALVVWSSVSGAMAAADARRERWGTTRTVMVTTRRVAAGEPLVAIARQYPVAMVPTDALVTLSAGAAAAHAMSAGEVLTRADVAGERAPPSSWVVFAVAGRQRPQVVVGDAVSLFGDGLLLCDGVVAAVTEERVDVAVPPSCAPAVSTQVGAGSVVLARAELS